MADTVNDVSFSSDGKTLVFGSQTAVVMWDIDAAIAMWGDIEGTTLGSVQGLGPVVSVAFSPDGKRLASGQWADAFIRLWDINTGEQIKNFGEVGQHIRSIAISPNGKLLAVGSNNSSTIPIFDMETGKLIKELQHRDGIGAVTFSHDGKMLASGASVARDVPFAIKLWDVNTGTELETLTGHTGPIVSALAFSPDGKTLASGSGDGTTRLWDVNSGQEMKSLSGKGSVSSVAFSPDGKMLASAGSEGLIIWDVANLDGGSAFLPLP